MASFQDIEKKWQRAWKKFNIFSTKEDSKKKKYYCLEMFPYPSGEGLHMGHARNYSIGDCYARYKRMQGFNVLYPMGFDSFGLPAENAAIKNKTHPKTYTEKAIASIKKSQIELGLSYDWSRVISTCSEEYYRWNQLFFLEFYKKGLAYRKKAPINWCPSCQTVLANEQVIDGKCWRCDSQVEIKSLEQWFFKITEYADELLGSIKDLQWPDRIKTMQENWIGKSEGTLVKFKLKNSNDFLEVFTTRIDTIFSTTFLVMAPEHPKALELVRGSSLEEAKKFIRKVAIDDRFTRTSEDKGKEGFFTGKYAINPATSEEIPVYLANFVLMDYGTGIVMANAHDKRDYEFAEKYNIPLKIVLKHKDGKELKENEIYTDYGILINSDKFNGLTSKEAIPSIQKWLKAAGLGKRVNNYKLRDWLISRQRYWGTPIPIIYCSKCGIQAVKKEDLPVKLPEDVEFTGEGNPLFTNKKFLEVNCPKCNSKAKRETDTMDTFVDSSWYFLRYTSPKNNKEPFDKKLVKYWLPVDQYIGGAEHAVLHLLYARFFTKVLRDLKYLNFDEPFAKLFNQGTVTKDSAKMSKSKGNIVTQEEISNKYGIDTARFFLLFVASPDKDLEWSDKGIEGSFRIIKRIYSLYEKRIESKSKKFDRNLESKTNKLIKDITNNIEDFKFNIALIQISEFVNYINKNKEDFSKDRLKYALETLTTLSSPFIPHLAEECWEKLGKKPFVSLERWPKFDANKIDKELEYEEELIENLMSDIRYVKNLIKTEPKEITIIISPKWKYEFYKEFKKITKEINEPKEIMKFMMKEELREHGKEVSKLVPKLIKNKPDIILSQEKEFKIFKENKNTIEKEFNCKVKIEKAESSKSEKSKFGLPAKPSIVLN